MRRHSDKITLNGFMVKIPYWDYIGIWYMWLNIVIHFGLGVARLQRPHVTATTTVPMHKAFSQLSHTCTSASFIDTHAYPT